MACQHITMSIIHPLRGSVEFENIATTTAETNMKQIERTVCVKGELFQERQLYCKGPWEIVGLHYRILEGIVDSWWEQQGPIQSEGADPSIQRRCGQIRLGDRQGVCKEETSEDTKQSSDKTWLVCPTLLSPPMETWSGRTQLEAEETVLSST